MRRPGLVTATGFALVLGLSAMAGAATGPEEATGTILDIEATILDITETIVDLDAGTATSTSGEQITIRLEADVFFDFDQAVLRPDAQETLINLVEQIREQGVAELHVAGHTDSIGTAEYNQDLSERRAAAVGDFLASQLQGVEITTEGFGFTQPIAANETDDGEDYPEGRALNRRVEIRFGR
jgi:outer membrane protein OmpA-like peptidoglycan-associated protein